MGVCSVFNLLNKIKSFAYVLLPLILATSADKDAEYAKDGNNGEDKDILLAEQENVLDLLLLGKSTTWKT